MSAEPASGASPDRIAVLGLGLMGRPLARTLLAAGHDVVGWNRSALAPPLVEGIPLAGSLGEAAERDVLVLMLADSSAVDAVLSALDGHLRAGQLVVDMGSSEPWRSEAHAARLEARAVGWVDAPVSGGPEGAARGSLAIMVGGRERDVERAWPLLLALGTGPVRVGGPGAGHTAKLANQAIVGVLISATAEALALAERAGLDPGLVLDALRGGSADTRITNVQGRRMVARDYEPRAYATTLVKDLATAAELARRVGMRLPTVDRVLELGRELVAAGEGSEDFAALHRLRLEDGPASDGPGGVR
ncbi:MAG: NAD(P)-dependent oxidoreductase [Thermoleophilia bacterium]